MNREQKRLLQRQGEIGEDGTPVAAARQRRTPNPTPSRDTPRGTPLSFFRGVRQEMRKVSWPTREEVRRYSIVVLITVAVMIVLIALLDYAFSRGAIFLFK